MRQYVAKLKLTLNSNKSSPMTLISSLWYSVVNSRQSNTLALKDKKSLNKTDDKNILLSGPDYQVQQLLHERRENYCVFLNAVENLYKINEKTVKIYYKIMMASPRDLRMEVVNELLSRYFVLSFSCSYKLSKYFFSNCSFLIFLSCHFCFWNFHGF